MKALCLSCRQIIEQGSQCKCPNNTRVAITGVVEGKNPRHVMKLDPSGLARAITPIRNFKVQDLSREFKCLLSEPLRLYNWTDEQVAVIKSSRGIKVSIDNPADVSYLDSIWPIPILNVSLSADWKVEVTGVKKDDKIVAPEFLATRLIAAGYTNVYAPDETAASLVIDARSGQRLGVRRLTKFST